jgi:hypothetical protein
MSINFYPLNDVHEIMNQMGFEPGYAYDDLIFSDNAIFIVQFNKSKKGEVMLHINKDCIESVESKIRKTFPEVAKKKGISVVQGIAFSMEQKEDTEEIELVFNPK